MQPAAMLQSVAMLQPAAMLQPVSMQQCPTMLPPFMQPAAMLQSAFMLQPVAILQPVAMLQCSCHLLCSQLQCCYQLTISIWLPEHVCGMFGNMYYAITCHVWKHFYVMFGNIFGTKMFGNIMFGNIKN